jgi:regulator of RNase E activity RraA
MSLRVASGGVSEDATKLSAEEREELLDRYEGLRVTDVTDGLDAHGFHGINRMHNDIRPLHRDVENFSHRFVGFAHTIRFLPTNKRRNLPHDEDLDYDTFSEWAGEWYGEHSGEPTDIQENDVIVFEAHDLNVGNIGSMNGLSWIADGAVGIVTNGGIRDTDEVIKQGIPAYTERISKTIIPGRDEFDAEQVPVNVGGCQIRPDDIVVADGDGVVVVPIEHAEAVGEAARREQQGDQESRRELYDEVGLEADFTLE